MSRSVESREGEKHFQKISELFAKSPKATLALQALFDAWGEFAEKGTAQTSFTGFDLAAKVYGLENLDDNKLRQLILSIRERLEGYYNGDGASDQVRFGIKEEPLSASKKGYWLTVRETAPVARLPMDVGNPVVNETHADTAAGLKN